MLVTREIKIKVTMRWCYTTSYCSVTQSCLTVCYPMDCSMPSFPVLHHLLELAQTHVLWVDDAIQPSHPLSPLHVLSIFPRTRSFPMSWFFTSGGQSIGTSTSASVLPKNIQNWFPLGLTGFISLQTERLSRVFSSTTIKKHQFFSTQPSLRSNSHTCTWLLEKP